MSRTPGAPVARILRVYRSANAEQIARGLAWYAAAYGEAQRIADIAAIRTDQAAGIIAALSPQTPWGSNLAWAEELALGGLTSRGFGLSHTRGMEILHSPGDPLEILGGPKVRAFYAGIIARGETDQVCVDRHAYDIATGIRGSHESLTLKRYRETAQAYRRAANRLEHTGETRGLYAAQLQAITWVTWRDRYWSPGSYDPIDRGRAPLEGEVAW